MKKALWVESFGSGDFDRLLDHAQEADASLLCIRTTSSALPQAIPKFKAHQITVYAWRWPAVKDQPYKAPHYFADREAEYVVEKLIPAGLDGYIVDPESDRAGDPNDWNDSSHHDLAVRFCSTIRSAAPAGFHFGTTSGCEYPRNHAKIPWAAFVAASDALYPQAYWRNSKGILHGGTPASSLALAKAAWSKIANGKPLIAMAGELDVALPQEVKDFCDLVRNDQGIAHFYVDSATTTGTILRAISAA
jgi:hypothetical protein